VSLRPTEDLYLFNINAGDLAKPVQKMPYSATIQEVAKKMAIMGIGSMLLHEPSDSDDIVGIITDTDFRTKVVATGMSFSKPAKDIMSLPVSTVPAEEICFDVLVKMMSRGIRHLAVSKGGAYYRCDDIA
jgi:CBS domain-containing protein